MKKKEKSKIIIANWKANLTYQESLSLAKKLKKILGAKKPKNELIVLPDFLALMEVKKNIKLTNLSLGAQDLSPFPLGAYTGEVSLELLEEQGLQYVLIGHSERRSYFFDKSLVALKMKNVLENSNLTPILCVGENQSQRNKGETYEFIFKQLDEAFKEVNLLKKRRIFVAYEPIWAIGTGRVASPSDVSLVHKKIREYLKNKYKNFLDLAVLYGGSVNLKNYQSFSAQKEISGLLIGGASLKADDFIEIASNFH